MSMWCRNKLLIGYPNPISRGSCGVRHVSKACYKNRIVSRKGAKEPSHQKQMIASELRNVFDKSKLVAVFHYNDLNTREWNTVRQKLSKSNLKVKLFPSKVASKAIENTKYGNITPLFRGCTVIVFGNEPSVSDMLTCIKSEAKLLLLGGLVDDQLFTPSGLREFAELQSMELLHQQLLGTLILPQMMLGTLLQSTSQRLSQMLEQVAETSDSHP